MIDGDGYFLRFGQYGRSSYSFMVNLFSTRMNSFTFMLDFYVYPVFIFIALSFGAWGLRNEAWWTGLALLFFGYAIWTFVEYLMHRFAFHHMPGIKALHMAHHADADALIGTPSALSLVLIFVWGYLPAAYLLGIYQGCFVSAGIMAGYLAFSAVHFIVHRSEHSRFKFIRNLKRGHAIHHYGDNQHNFGVTTLVWDRVFGTYSDKMR
jgi:sterol desaturase/sphingolipid hydroxylase (fatty acid hydroxylase superfamily)